MLKFRHLTLAVLLICIVRELEGHGRFTKPASRSSLWRNPRFASLNPPKNYDDTQLFCGGIHQAENPGNNCGVCGDPKSEQAPRANEVGGRFYKGIITGKYRSGQVIEVEVEITAAHHGFMQWRLCTDPRQEIQECFNRHLLRRADGKGSRVRVSRTGIYKAKLKLPSGVKCDKCVIQWNYRAGNNWGVCKSGKGAVGCGPQGNVSDSCQS